MVGPDQALIDKTVIDEELMQQAINNWLAVNEKEFDNQPTRG